MRLELVLAVGIVFFCCWCAYVIIKMHSSVITALPSDLPQANRAPVLSTHQTVDPDNAPDPSIRSRNKLHYQHQQMRPQFSHHNQQQQDAGMHLNHQDSFLPTVASYNHNGNKIQDEHPSRGSNRQFEANSPVAFFASSSRMPTADVSNGPRPMKVNQYQAQSQFLRPNTAEQNLASNLWLRDYSATSATPPASIFRQPYYRAPQSGPTSPSSAHWRASSVPYRTSHQTYPSYQRNYDASGSTLRVVPSRQHGQQRHRAEQKLDDEQGQVDGEPETNEESESADQSADEPQTEYEPESETKSEPQEEQSVGEDDQVQSDVDSSNDGPVNRELDEQIGRRTFSEDEWDSKERDKNGNLIVTQRRHLVNGKPVATRQLQSTEAPGMKKRRSPQSGSSAFRDDRHLGGDDFDKIVDEIENIDNENKAAEKSESSPGGKPTKPRKFTQPGFDEKDADTSRVSIDKREEKSSLRGHSLGKQRAPNRKLPKNRIGNSASESREVKSIKLGEEERPGEEPEEENDEVQEPAKRKQSHEHRVKESLVAQQWDDDASGPKFDTNSNEPIEPPTPEEMANKKRRRRSIDFPLRMSDLRPHMLRRSSVDEHNSSNLTPFDFVKSTLPNVHPEVGQINNGRLANWRNLTISIDPSEISHQGGHVFDNITNSGIYPGRDIPMEPNTTQTGYVSDLTVIKPVKSNSSDLDAVSSRGLTTEPRSSISLSEARLNSSDYPLYPSQNYNQSNFGRNSEPSANFNNTKTRGASLGEMNVEMLAHPPQVTYEPVSSSQRVEYAINESHPPNSHLYHSSGDARGPQDQTGETNDAIHDFGQYSHEPSNNLSYPQASPDSLANGHGSEQFVAFEGQDYGPSNDTSHDGSLVYAGFPLRGQQQLNINYGPPPPPPLPAGPEEEADLSAPVNDNIVDFEVQNGPSQVASGSKKKKYKMKQEKKKKKKKLATKYKAAKKQIIKKKSKHKKGGVKKKKKKAKKRLAQSSKSFKGLVKGHKSSKGAGQKGAKKGALYYKDKGYKKKGFKKHYEKTETGDHKTYFDEFRDKDHKKKWKNFKDKHNYSQSKKWAGNDLKKHKNFALKEMKAKKSGSGAWDEKYKSKYNKDLRYKAKQKKIASKKSKKKMKKKDD